MPIFDDGKVKRQNDSFPEKVDFVCALQKNSQFSILNSQFFLYLCSITYAYMTKEELLQKLTE